MNKVVLLICDVWDNHYCADLRRRIEPLTERINAFADVVRRCGGKVIHCPSETVDTHYAEWPQRRTMLAYPKTETTILQEMRPIHLPLQTRLTTGCPDTPQCRYHCEYTKQHDRIKILPEDLISDSGQEILNYIVHEGVGRILMSGLALNMCILGRPFGVVSMVEAGVRVSILSDLVEIFYSPEESPYISIEQAKWFALGYIQAKWCPTSTCNDETKILERVASIKSNIPRDLVANFQRRWDLKYFVETGTAQGHTTELAAIAFDKVWSCDTNPRMIDTAAKRLSTYTNVQLSLEESPKFLTRIQPFLNKPTIYWLDAHWCGGPRPHRECPLLGELRAIGTLSKNSVILIDDMELIEAPPPRPHNPRHWPNLQRVQQAVARLGNNLDVSIHQGPNRRVMVVTPGERK